jgi:hypothetical protein
MGHFCHFRDWLIASRQIAHYSVITGMFQATVACAVCNRGKARKISSNFRRDEFNGKH